MKEKRIVSIHQVENGFILYDHPGHSDCGAWVARTLHELCAVVKGVPWETLNGVEIRDTRAPAKK